MDTKFVKSPLNYIGNKYRLLPQIEVYFPKNIVKMVDLFCGGCDVTINTQAELKYANDINSIIIDMFKTFQGYDKKYILEYIDETIEKRQLSRTNKESFLAFREYYNQIRNPLDLFVLMCYSFNYQFRFNSKHEYNSSFGKNKSQYSETTKRNLEILLDRIKDVNFTSKEFQDFDYSILNKGDFLYADPPYLISCGPYNDGKRGFKDWDEQQERDLYAILDNLNKQGILFALSNVMEHKGLKNEILLDWCKENDYIVHDLTYAYNHSNYHSKNTDKVTREVLITNY